MRIDVSFADFSYVDTFCLFSQIFRLPFWSYAKGVATFVSVTQCFIRPYLSMIPYVRRPDSLSADSIARDQSVILREPESSVRASERETFEGEPHEPARSATSQVRLVCLSAKEIMCTETPKEFGFIYIS